MIFDKVNLTLVVNPLESVRAESVHESVSLWCSSVREKNGDLVKSLWSVRPEIEDGVWISQVGLWISLLAMKEIWELDWIIDEEDWSIISDHIVVAFLSVELDGETTWISHSVWSTSLTSHSRESHENWSLLTNLVQEASPAEFCHIIGDLEHTMSARSLCMHSTLWNSFSVEVSKFVNKMKVLENDWSPWASSHRVLVVVNWITRASGQLLSIVFHLF